MSSSSSSDHPNAELLESKLFSVNGFKAVTGGGTSIGLMITQVLVANGATDYITGRPDITDKEDVKRLTLEIKEKEPKGIHLLVNNAGVATEKETASYKTGEPGFSNADSITEHLWKATPESWAETLETNLTQSSCSAAPLPPPPKGTANTLGYILGVNHKHHFNLGRAERKQLRTIRICYLQSRIHPPDRMLGTTFAECKVRVNSIAPGILPSEMTANTSDENQKSELKSMGQSIPAKRTGSGADMTAAVLYLAGPGGVFLSGQVLYPDGGNILTSPSAT